MDPQGLSQGLRLPESSMAGIFFLNLVFVCQIATGERDAAGSHAVLETKWQPALDGATLAGHTSGDIGLGAMVSISVILATRQLVATSNSNLKEL